MATPPGPSSHPYGSRDPEQQPGWPQQGGPPGTPPGQGYPGGPQAGYPQQPGFWQQPGYPQQGYGQQPGYPQYPGGAYGAVGQPPEDPLVPADFGGWLEKIIDVVRRSFVPLLQIQLAVAVVSVVVTLLLGGPMTNLTPEDLQSGQFGAVYAGGAFVALLLTIAVELFAVVASVYIVVTQANEQRGDLGAALRFSPKRVLPLLGWGILAGLILLVGYVLLILPGLYFTTVFLPTLYGVVIIERRGIGRCFTLVHNRFLPTLGRVLLALVALTVVYLILTFAVLLPLGADSVLATIVEALIGIVVEIVWIAFVVVSYAELRFHDREGPGVLTPTLAGELRR